MNEFNPKFREYMECWSGGQGSIVGNQYIADINESIKNSTDVLKEFMQNNQNKGIDYLKGDVAEFWHSETLKINATVIGDNSVYSNVPRNAGAVDIEYGSQGRNYEAQVKYYKNAEETAKAISNPKYEGMEKVVPKDQLDDVKSAAGRLAAKNADSRPNQANQYEDTIKNVNDRLKADKSESIPLSENEAKKLVQDFKNGEYDSNDYGLNTETLVNFSDIARQSSEAAIQAALISAVIQAGPYLYKIMVDCINNGEIDIENIRAMGVEVVSDSSWNGLRAGIASFLTASCKSGLLGESMKTISPTVIGAATVVAVNSVRNSILLSKGIITSSEYAERCLHDTVIVSFGVLGTTIGQALIPVPILGGLIGNFIGGIMGTIIYQLGNDLILAIAIDKGWTFFNFVDQNFTVPESVLQKAGYDLFLDHSFSTQSFSTFSFSRQSFKTNSIDIIPLKRGVIGIRKIGYIPI